MSGEFDFIEIIRQRAAEERASSPDLRLGIGDDAAVLAEETGRETLLTVDLLVEEVDFRLEYAVPRWLGHKALAVSLSDIAAMGGRPHSALLTLGIPPGLIPREEGDNGWRFWSDFFDGYFELARSHEVVLVGGDISATPERLTVDSFVLGHCQRGRAIRRSGARVGEAIYLTGALGASAVGLRLLLGGQQFGEATDDLAHLARRVHLAPEPRVEFGRRLGESGLVGAMIDISDGLAQDLGHVCTASGVAAIIDYSRVPVSPTLGLLELDPPQRFSLAISGGEDFELLFTAPPTHETRLRQLAGSDLPLTRIGLITERGPAGQSPLTLHGDGPPRPLSIRGHNHFKHPGSNTSAGR